MTPAEALADLEAKRSAIPDAMAEGRRALGTAAVSSIRRQWPVGDGSGPHSRDAWRNDEARQALVNDLPHTAHVRNRLADRLVPEILKDLHSVYEDTVTAALDAARGK